MRTRPFLLALLASLVACKSSAPSSGLLLADMDRTVAPGTDFYRFVNGGWLARNPVPADESSWGVFEEIQKQNDLVLREILAQPGDGELHAGLAAYYASGMDEDAIEAAGLAPLTGELAAIDAAGSVADLPALFARLTRIGSSVPFVPMVFADLKDASRNLLYLVQDGTGLPEKDYYLRDDADSVALREEYRAHVGRMLALSGDAQAEAHAAAILALETELARNGYGALDFRDPAKLANKISMNDLAALAPGFDWTAYLMALGMDALQPVNVVAPDYFRALDGFLAARPLPEWKAYLRWHLLRSQADYLPRAFEQESFAFFGRTLGGAQEQRPRWKRVIEGVGGTSGEALGQLFVERTFSPVAKERCALMVADLLAAFRVRLENLAWMSDETRARALAKLATFRTKIGYPDRWRDYTGLELGQVSYVENHMRATAFELAWNLAKAGQPVDKAEWGMPAYVVNAGYDATNNDITFPAGILQPPFFSEHYDDALNYGAMGAVIGHEITHGFDDQGSRFDAAGNFTDWWTAADRAEFERRALVVEEQFSQYVAVDDLAVNGKLTLGENLADLAGLTIAYDALMLRQQNQRVAPIDGFTPAQRFFIAWARAWRSSDTPESRRLQVQTDPHAPADLRVLGPLSNLQAFQDAFGLPDDSPMLRPRAERAQVW